MNTIGDVFGSIFGGGGGGSSQPTAQTIQTNTTEIPAPLLPYFQGTGGNTGILPEAERLYDEGGIEYFPGSTVTPFSGNTQLGMDAIAGMAREGSPLIGTSQDNLMGLLGAQGQGQHFGLGTGVMGDIARGDLGIDTSGLENIAGGGLLGQNPYIDQVIGDISEDATNAVNRNAFFGGREGSPFHAGAVAENVARVTAPIRMQDYASERGMMQGAMNQVAGIQGTNIANQYQGAQGLLGADINAQNQMMRGIGAAPGVYDFGMQPSRYLMDIGSMEEAKSFEELQDQIARHDFEQQQPYDALARYQGFVGGAPLISSSSTSTYAPQPSFSGGGLLGGALGGATLASMLNPAYAGYGALGGGLLGGFNF